MAVSAPARRVSLPSSSGDEMPEKGFSVMLPDAGKVAEDGQIVTVGSSASAWMMPSPVLTALIMTRPAPSSCARCALSRPFGPAGR